MIYSYFSLKIWSDVFPLEGYLLFLYYFSGKLIEKQRVASVVLVVLVMVLVVLGVV